MTRSTTLQYELLAEDILGLTSFIASTSAGRRIVRVQYVPGAVLALILAVLTVLLGGVRDPFLVALTVTGVAGAFMIAWRAYVRSYYFSGRSNAVTANRTGTGLGQHTLSFDECGIREVGPIRTVQLRWSAVDGVHETADLFILPVGLSGQFVVPKRAFSSVSEAEAFRTEALARWRAARAWGGPPCAK